MLLIAASVLLCLHGTLADAAASEKIDIENAASDARAEAGEALSDDGAHTQAITLSGTLAAVRQTVTNALNIDLSPYKARLKGHNLGHYSTYAACADVFADIADALCVSVRSAVEGSMPVLSSSFRSMSIPLNPTDLRQFNAPDWKCIAALYYTFGDEFLLRLAESMKTSFIVSDNGGRALMVRFGTPDEMAAGGDQADQMHVKLAYAYLNTVYDDDGNAILTEKHVYPKGYLEKVVHPVPGFLIKNCWFDPRDNGKRLHTGADIKADGKTPILSVTDGVVTYIGRLPVPGNYVVVLDPYGYEYHYYHMRERTKLVTVGDAVKAGDPIGRVGNTGNSAANHLHLAIISPEHRYLNPYDLFVQAGIGPIRPDGETGG